MKKRETNCAICGCLLHREGGYAKPTVSGRSHATVHHYVPERFFGRSKNRPNTKRDGIFNNCPWNAEGKTVVFCYECHEELIHNPVFSPEDIQSFASLVRNRELHEDQKPESREKIAGRIKLLNEVIQRGLEAISKEENS